MITFSWIQGLVFGLEYADDEEIGFMICLDLGVIRLVWYKDLTEEDWEE